MLIKMFNMLLGCEIANQLNKSDEMPGLLWNSSAGRAAMPSAGPCPAPARQRCSPTARPGR
jgi:hypothetical protein